MSAEWGWRKQKKMEGEIWEGESESLGIEMDQEDTRNSMWRPMADRQLIYSAPGQGRKIVVWEKSMLKVSGLPCSLLH